MLFDGELVLAGINGLASAISAALCEITCQLLQKKISRDCHQAINQLITIASHTLKISSEYII